MKKNLSQGGKRHLKVYPKYFERSCRPVVFPEIRLCGKWLQDCGFSSGQEVTVMHTQNKIIITGQNSAQHLERNQ